MSTEKPAYRPLKSLEMMEGNNHIVLLYDNQKHADMVIGRYLLNGLEKGESCIYFTTDNPDAIKKKLSSQGIDVDLYMKKDSLRIFGIEKSDSNKSDALATLKRIREESTRGMKPPFRFVGRTVTDTETIAGMEQGLVVESTGHRHFEDFGCSQMCYYDISAIERSKKDRWITGLLKNHHYVIYASRPERAVAFETALLENG
jgi:DcmR-like sensory protein